MWTDLKQRFSQGVRAFSQGTRDFCLGVQDFSSARGHCPLTIDSLCYEEQDGTITFDVPAAKIAAFPRNFLSVDGFICPVSALSSADRSRIYRTNGFLKLVCIPASVTAISVSFFAGFDALSIVSFEFGSKLSRIEEYAFQRCGSLACVSLPSSVTVLESKCFLACTLLTNVFLDRNSSLREIRESAFASCQSLTSFPFPSSVRQIGKDCFAGCRNLTRAIFTPVSQLSHLGDGAFRDCKLLDTFSIPNRSACLGLFSVSMAAIRAIHLDMEEQFFRWSGACLFAQDTTRLVFSYDHISEMVVPDSVEVLGSFCFQGHLLLTSLIFGPGSRLSCIENGAFCRCSELQSVSFPASLERIDGKAFDCCAASQR
jgi:hypothetical protein